MKEQQQRAQRQRQAAVATLPNPSEVGAGSRMEQAVLEMSEALRPDATQKAFDPKIEEFFGFCDLLYPTDLYRCNLTHDKVHEFMFFVSFRDNKNKTGTKESRKARKEAVLRGEHFDLEDYRRVIAAFRSNDDGEITEANWPKPKYPTGHQNFNQCKAVFRKIYKVQTAKRVLNIHWEAIWQLGLEMLQQHVKNRTPQAKKASYAEKLASEFAPCAAVEECPNIEQELWVDSQHGQGRRGTCSGLRCRHCLLQLTSGVLHCESLCRAELSDFLSIRPPKRDTDVHAPLLMVNQIVQGKTNKNRTLHGRSTRHRDPLLCCIGALGFHLCYRFWISNEFAAFMVDDWCDNNKWFDIKLLVDVFSDDLTKSMKNCCYAKKIKSVLTRLKLALCKLLHLGRNIGAKLLELMEEEDDAIRRMGQWNPSVCDNSYSVKLPMGPIRKLAGFGDGNSLCFNTRTVVLPSDELRRMTPFGSWCYDAFTGVVMKDQSKTTALGFLKFMCELNDVLLQDAAAIMVLHPERADHSLFRDMEVFRSPEFEAFKNEVQFAIENERCPLDAKLETVLPGVHQWHTANNTAVKAVERRVDHLSGNIGELAKAVNDGFVTFNTTLVQSMTKMEQSTTRELAQSFFNIASQLSGRPPVQLVCDQGAQGEEDDTSLGETLGLKDVANSALATLATAATAASPSTANTALPAVETAITMETTPELVPAPVTGRLDKDSAEARLTARVGEKFVLRPRHVRLQNLWEEWWGVGRYHCELGGVDGRNKRWKAHWRLHLDNQQVSRTGRVILGIQNYAERESASIEDAIDNLEETFSNNKFSVHKMAEFFKAQQLLSTKGKRGRKKQDSSS